MLSNINIRELLKIFDEAKTKSNHDELFNFIIGKLIKIFDADMVLHFHNEQNRTRVINEAFKEKNHKTFLEKDIFCCPSTNKRFFPYETSFIVRINDVDKDIEDEHCKEHWKKKGLISFLSYTPGFLELSRKDIKIIGGTLIGFSKAKKWSEKEVDTLKIIIDSATAVFIGIQERQEAENSKRNYMATLTHDLRTPIVAGQKVLEYILSQSSKEEMGKYRELLEGIRDVNEDLLLQINNLLSVYHFEAGDFIFHCEKFDIKEIIDEAVGMIKNLAIGDSFDIKVDIENGIPSVYASRGDIKRVITNLLANALKHNEKGTKVNISVKKQGDFVEFLIADDGQGVKKELQENVFKRYVNLKGRTGSGLGLYLSKQIIEAHKGEIWFETKEREGSKFYFRLPIGS